MSSTKKGNDWYFGMKAHIGVDADSGVTHSLETSTAKLHDSQVWDDLLHGEETSVWPRRASVPRHQPPVRLRKDPLSRPRQEPRPALHAVRAR